MDTPGRGARPGARVADLTWPEVEQRLGCGDPAILPVGAAAKEHGLHLPMDTDRAQVRWLCERLVERHPVLVWPTLSYGHYPAFVDYPGSLTLSAHTFRDVAVELLAGIERAGAQRILVLNTGISTIEPLRKAVRPGRAELLNVHDGPRYRAAAGRLAEQRSGGHGDELETSIMLAIAPHRVLLERAKPADDRPLVPGPFQRRDPDAPNFSPQGIHGDPTLATADKGRALLAAMLEDIDAVIAGTGGQTLDSHRTLE